MRSERTLLTVSVDLHTPIAAALEETGLPGLVDANRIDAAAMLVADAIAVGDRRGLRLLVETLRRAERHRISDSSSIREAAIAASGLVSVAEWALQRLPSEAAEREVQPNSHAHRFLIVLEENPGLNNLALADVLKIDESETSRIGRKLRDRGLVQKRQFGRWNSWSLTPRGTYLLHHVFGGSEPPTVARYPLGTYRKSPGGDAAASVRDESQLRAALVGSVALTLGVSIGEALRTSSLEATSNESVVTWSGFTDSAVPGAVGDYDREGESAP